MNDKTILIINHTNSLSKIIKGELIQNLEINTIYLYDNNHTMKYKIKRKYSNSRKNNQRFIRIITAKALQQEINYFHQKNFEYFLSRNLPITADKMTTVAIILKNRLAEEKIFFHVFNNSEKDAENDIPFFHKNAPDGYSFFCSRDEFSQLVNFLRKNKKVKKIKKLEQEKIELEPSPNKKHNICQICKIKYEDYLEHIHSKFHERNKLNYSDSFLKIKNTFKRIVIFNKFIKEKKEEGKNKEWENIRVITYKKKKEIKESVVNSNENISSNIISENSNNNTTKCDSFLNENKLPKRKRIKGGTKINNISTSNKKEKKDNIDISLKDIKCLLKSIKCRPVVNYYNKQKRKKTEINKNIFNENYLYDFQKITGKISYLDSLYNMKNY